MKHLYQFIDLYSGWRSAIFTNYKAAMRLAEEHADSLDHSVNLLTYEASLSGTTYTLKSIRTYRAYRLDE